MRSIGLPELLVIFGMLMMLGFALLLAVLVLRRKQGQAVQRAIIDKLPANDLAGMMQTPQGERLVQAISGASPWRSILATMRIGIGILAAGVGMVVASVAVHASREAAGVGIIMIFVGIGLLVSAFITYRLSKQWRLLDGNGSSRRPE